MGGFTPRRCESGSGGGENKGEGCKRQNKAKERGILPVARIAFEDVLMVHPYFDKTEEGRYFL